jgi:hypothetical protein
MCVLHSTLGPSRGNDPAGDRLHVLSNPRDHELLCPSAWTAVMKYHRLGGFSSRHLFLWFWRLEVQDQVASTVGFG